MKKTIAIISLVMCLLFSAIPVGAESIFLQMNTASFEKYQTMSDDLNAVFDRKGYFTACNEYETGGFNEII